MITKSPSDLQPPFNSNSTLEAVFKKKARSENF